MSLYVFTIYLVNVCMIVFIRSCMPVCCLQGRAYGIGWGPRDLEYRNTIATVSSIDENDVRFCIMGLPKPYTDGYYVSLKKQDAERNAMCLIDWCKSHPEDAQPREGVVHV